MKKSPLYNNAVRALALIGFSDSTAPQPLSFTIDSPARIAVDLPGTTMAMSQRKKTVNSSVLNSILAAESNGRTRVVLDLDSLVPYQTRTEGNTVVLTLGSGSTGYSNTYASEVVRSSQPVQSYDAYSSSSSSNSLNAIDFRRGKDGAGQVVVKLSNPNAGVDINEEAGNIVATFNNSDIRGDLLRAMDVLDFGTPITNIIPERNGNNVRLVIKANGLYEQLAYQSDDSFTVEVREREIVPDELLGIEEREYNGSPISLNFQSIDVRSVLQVLADTGDFNIVVSDSVSGDITLRLRNVPWDQALDIVLQTKGLDKRTKDNVILVAPAAEIANQEQQKLQARNSLKELAPLRSDFIQINYAKASDIKDLLETNTLLIYDTVEQLEGIRRLIETLDIPVSQVLIESRVVIASTDFSREIGVRAGFTAVTDNSSDGIISVSGSAIGNDTTIGSAIESRADNGVINGLTLPAIGDRLNVNLPVTAAAGRIGAAILDNDFLVELELSALQAEGRGEIISSPRVTATNQQEATILQGVEIPFQENSGGAGGATTTSFKEAALNMTVTPLITPDDYVIMDLSINQDSVGQLVASETGSVPSIDTRQLITQVRVPNGETAVLGGIYETSVTYGETKVPVLGDLPVVGNLFKNRTRRNDKSEMLIFITPTILINSPFLYRKSSLILITPSLNVRVLILHISLRKKVKRAFENEKLILLKS